MALAALFPIVNPVGKVPAFLSLTEGLDPRERRAEALKAAASAAAVLVAFLLIGRLVLDLFDISLAAIEFIGGLIVGYLGWMMLTQPQSLSMTEEGEEAGDVYFTPLAFPLLAGPGALGVVLGLENRADSPFDFPGYVIGILVIAAAIYLTLGHAGRFAKLLGPSGLDVLSRILGVVVLAIAAELVFHGIADHFELATVED